MSISTGDIVHHGPTGEDWVVRYVKGDKLAWCGWPPGEADLADCTLIRKATGDEQARLLGRLDATPGAEGAA